MLAAAEEYSLVAAVAIVLYVVGLDIALKVVDTIAPEVAVAVRTDAWLERALRTAIALIVPVAISIGRPRVNK